MRRPLSVMAAPASAIDVFLCWGASSKAWMAATSPAMTPGRVTLH